MTTPREPDWYDDPDDPNAQRWWNGQVWTPHRQRKSPAPKPAAPLMPPPPPPSLLPPPPAPPISPTQSNPLSRKWPIVAAVVVLIAVLGAGTLWGVHKLKLFESDEDQIKEVTQELADAYNKRDAATILTLACTGVKAEIGQTHFVDAFTNSLTSAFIDSDLEQYGSISLSLNNIHVTGSKATAALTVTRSKYPERTETGSQAFVEEDGSWKICE